MELTVRDVQARGLDLPLSRPMETAAGVMPTAPLVLIDLLTEEGITGRSYLRAYTPVALEPLVQLVLNLEPLVRGEVADPGSVQEKLHRHFRLLGPQRRVRHGHGGDRPGPLGCPGEGRRYPSRLPGGSIARADPRVRQPSNDASGGAAAEAEEVLAQGFKAVKVKIGRGDLAADLETILCLS